jgi:hypothetical protein
VKALCCVLKQHAFVELNGKAHFDETWARKHTSNSLPLRLPIINSSDTGHSLSSQDRLSINSSIEDRGGSSEQTHPNNDDRRNKIHQFKEQLTANWRLVDDLRESRSTDGLPMGYLEAKPTSIKENEGIVMIYLGSTTDTAAEVVMKEVRSAWAKAWGELEEGTTGDKLLVLLNYVQTALEEQVLCISTNEVF